MEGQSPFSWLGEKKPSSFAVWCQVYGMEKLVFCHPSTVASLARDKKI